MDDITSMIIFAAIYMTLFILFIWSNLINGPIRSYKGLRGKSIGIPKWMRRK